MIVRGWVWLGTYRRALRVQPAWIVFPESSWFNPAEVTREGHVCVAVLCSSCLFASTSYQLRNGIRRNNIHKHHTETKQTQRRKTNDKTEFPVTKHRIAAQNKLPHFWSPRHTFAHGSSLSPHFFTTQMIIRLGPSFPYVSLNIYNRAPINGIMHFYDHPKSV